MLVTRQLVVGVRARGGGMGVWVWVVLNVWCVGDGSTGQGTLKKCGQDQGPTEESLHRDLPGLGPNDFRRWACRCPKDWGLMV